MEDEGREEQPSGSSEKKEAKTRAAAMKSHSEAERRRRERINAHLATLRQLVPYNEKVDKAALLGEVINQVKQLKKSATSASEGLHIPTDSDEVKVETVAAEEEEEEGGRDGVTAGRAIFFIRASLCCDYRPDLASHIRRAVEELRVRVVRCEVSTLGGRVKSAFLMTPGGGGEESAGTPWEAVAASVHAAFADILKNVSASADYDQQICFPQKRRRGS